MLKRARLSVSVLAVLTAVAFASVVAADDIPAPSDVAAAPQDAEVTASGLASVVLAPGSGGRHPQTDSWVRVHYTGWTTDGKMFDSSIQRGASITLPLNRVIDGWTEGLQLMVEGEKRRLWIPEELAYAGREGRPQGMLVFDIELVDLVDPPTPPANLTAPPPDAEIHKKGLATKVLRPGHGDRTPRAESAVDVHYTGWTTDGEMFDTTVLKGQPVNFVLNAVIKGWTQGLQLMVEGEKRRLWIPEKLAYKGVEGRPQGMLIFDVELIAITVYE